MSEAGEQSTNEGTDMKKLMLLMTCAVTLSLVSGVVVSTDVVVGEWTSNFVAAKEYADANAVPMLVYWTNSGCTYCELLEDVFEKEEFRAWQKSRQMIMVFASNDATAKAFAKNDSGNFPYVAAYWNKGDGNVVLEKFTGRTGRMPCPSGTLLRQFTSSVDCAMGFAELPPFLVEDGELTFVNPNGLTEFVVPDGTTSIGIGAFSGCTNLMSVTIPNSVTNIGNSAFYGCSGLTSVTIGNGVTSIGASVFSGCSGLTGVTIPNSVTSIGGYAFFGCRGLTSVTIGNGVTSIGERAFSGCSGLTSVTIPNSVTSIGEAVFYGGSSLKEVQVPFIPERGILHFFQYHYDEYQDWLNSGSGGYIVRYDGNVPSSLKCIAVTGDGYDIPALAFESCSSLTSVTIGNGVTSIGERAFYGCSGLTSVTIGNGVTSIGASVFSGCSGLTGVTIPSSVTSIGDGAFSGCSELTGVTISDSVTDFSSSAFDGCGKLWTEWYRTLANISAASGSGGGSNSGSPSISTTIVQQVAAPYALSDVAADRTIASVTVDDDCAIDEFVLKDGKVYDSVLRIVNESSQDVKLTLPSGYTYETFEGVEPLTIPANSRNILTITRTEANTFLVSREKLKTIQ